MKACCLIRDQPHYRADAFRCGLEALGYDLTSSHQACDLLIIWNKYGGHITAAEEVEARGGRVLVAENGYLGNDFAGHRWYAISLSEHNGAGSWSVGHPDRWDSLGENLAPFREGGVEWVILPQRGIGPPGIAMPAQWPKYALSCAGAIRPRRPIRVRPHPGAHGAPCELLDDLEQAAGVITWGSGAATKALAAGIPVFYDFPAWIMAGAGRALADMGEGPNCDETARLTAFRRMAWAMWTLEEIESGFAFNTLLQTGQQ